MRTRDEVAADKLRGGFYTPPSLVRVCLDRIADLNGHRDKLAILEPSVGDGAFLRGVAQHRLVAYVGKFIGLEVIRSEVDKSRKAARDMPFPTSITNASAIDWAWRSNDWFDVVVGNPPFVRYQFVPDEEVASARKLAGRLGLSFVGVSNLWVPVLTGALARLRAGGLMAIVVPAEIFTGVSAGIVREWLLSNFTALQVDMFEPGSFPGVLQEVIVLSGRRTTAESRLSPGRAVRVTFVERGACGRGGRRRSHIVPVSRENWTKYLLEPEQVEALSEVRRLPGVLSFGKVAKLEVAIVTGANEFFSVSRSEVEEHGLETWIFPLLPRMRHAKGLVFTNEDHKDTVASGAKAWLLHFSENRPDPPEGSAARTYLDHGERQGLHLRYKTSIRTPWYRVPWVWPGTLMMSKRSHRFPRLVYNDAGVVTTDTIYRGCMRREYAGQESALVGGFHNSLTMLTAEIEGRSFGGGVLELVPSEIARLSVPLISSLGRELPRLDSLARECSYGGGEEERLIEATDELLRQRLAGYKELADLMDEARRTLARRRLSRN